MAFNGSGVHNRVHDWTQDLAGTIPVTASRMDAEHDDISAALSNAICRDGQSTTTARIPFASGLSCAAGTTSSVAFALTNDPNTGLYFPATDQWGLVAGGTAVLAGTSSGITVTGTQTVAGAADFGAAPVPTLDDGASLGSTSKKWSDLFLASGAVINFNSGDVTLTHSSNLLAFAGASSGYTFDAASLPATSDGAALGSASAMWSDLFLASGSVVNFNNGDVTITHSANALAFAGASSGYTFSALVSPESSDGAALGSASAQWSDLFLASGAVINYNNGDVTITHSADTLTVAGGKLVANDSAGITGRNTVKAFGKVVNGVLQSGSFNVTSVSAGVSDHTINFTNAMANANYAICITVDGVNGNSSVNMSYRSVSTGSFVVGGAVPGNGSIDPDSYSFMVLSNE